jgi:hypothetical protein
MTVSFWICRQSKSKLSKINKSSWYFQINSYELKREINSDSELKSIFFKQFQIQWANYGYLVAFEFSDSLNEEMARLNQSFGIGIIELNANYQSKVLYPSVFMI